MHIVAMIAGVSIIAVVLSDAFATIVLPRRVNQRFSPSRLVLLIGWRCWTRLARHLPGGVGREGAGRQSDFLSIFGPLALLGLVGLWATGLVVGFAVLLWGIQGPIAGTADGEEFGTLIYLSGTTFFTVGFGDITPASGIGRALAVIEGGTGLGFLAVVVSYLPTIFGAAARREAAITLLDARAGSPPTAAGLLSRTGPDPAALVLQLREWEQWAADLLETHLSYPILAFFRSQHERQSWLAALVVILDVSALVHVGVTADGQPILSRQARLTFAMARHVVGDLCQILNAPPHLSPAIDSRRPTGIKCGGCSRRKDWSWQRPIVPSSTWRPCAPSMSPTWPRWPNAPCWRCLPGCRHETLPTIGRQPPGSPIPATPSAPSTGDRVAGRQTERENNSPAPRHPDPDSHTV